jgi:hypothetical protein
MLHHYIAKGGGDVAIALFLANALQASDEKRNLMVNVHGGEKNLCALGVVSPKRPTTSFSSFFFLLFFPSFLFLFFFRSLV